MRIPASHPAFPGHFPGLPVVPGVVVLDAVVTALAERAGGTVRVTGFPAVKFTAVLPPEREFEVAFTDRQPGAAAFEVVCGTERVAAGTVVWEPAPDHHS